ncbi:ribonucleotide reductase subunit alpha [Orrella marina]|uniref:Ribonucleotide reductase subunit alpha n=1 Tax=Orrella marina TaxID=2163011 RepID=A0A2R4XN62_9BURK|nr:ribonucleotide reductase subunit alpha [Orrella marina]AWB35218.1 ribonucleotide reductase subunit alpha [Orrella marina]
MIDQFDDLLKLANEQALKQHLFLVYTIAELPEDSTEEQRREFEQGHGGALVPAASVDKRASDIKSFADLEHEARQFIPQWDILFVTAMDVMPGHELDEAQIATLMERVVEQIKSGQIGHFVSFDRQGNAVALN